MSPIQFQANQIEFSNSIQDRQCPNFPHMQLLQSYIRKLSEPIGVTLEGALIRDCPLTSQLLRSQRRMTTSTITGATPARSTLLRL